jgi:gamma-D-glutamyl-L-lysine dipeptidyl-peptidase
LLRIEHLAFAKKRLFSSQNLVMRILLLLLSGLLVACQPVPEPDLPSGVTDLVDAIRQEVAPDKRVALFQPEIRPGNDDQLILTGKTNLPEAANRLRNGLRELGFTLADSLRILPDTEQLDDQPYGLVHLSVCNIRSRPAHSAELSTQATLGTPLRVYEQDDNWYLVQTPDGYLGWLDRGGFTSMTAREWSAWTQANRVVYLPDLGFALAEPGDGADPVSDLVAGNILESLGTQGDFTEVGFPDGRTGYLPTADLMPFHDWLQQPAPSPDQILTTASQHLGRPYMWGGTSGKAMDCSGFTKTVFFLNGLLLPRDASQQVHVGTPIDADTSLANLQPGDFLFFGRAPTSSKPEKITHVAIYMGDGRIIHAAERVQIQSLRPGDPDFAPERLATFVRARRMLNSPEENGVPYLSQLQWYTGPQAQ